jgi:hypothetical protein
MRSIHGVFAVVTILALATAAMAAEPCCGNQGMWTDYGAFGGYCAPACAAPAYGLVPGCCEFPPSCCDHVWDGYCQELRGLDAVRALLPSRGLCGCGRRAGVCWGGGACGLVESTCCAFDGVEPFEAGESPREGLVEIPTAPSRSQ